MSAYRQLQLHKPLNMPGPGNNAQTLNCTGANTQGQRKGEVQHMVRDEAGYWMFIPAGINQGWFHVPFESVAYARGTPPQALLDMLKVDINGKPLPEPESVPELANGPVSKTGVEVDSAGSIPAALAVPAKDEGATHEHEAAQMSGAPKPQRKRKPTRA